MAMNQELLFTTALSLLKGIGPITAKKLTAHCGSVEAIFNERISALKKNPNIGDALAQQTLRLFNAQEQLIIELLSQREYVHIDELNRTLDLERNQLSSLLMNLELDQVIKLFPGMRFSLRKG